MTKRTRTRLVTLAVYLVNRKIQVAQEARREGEATGMHAFGVFDITSAKHRLLLLDKK